MKKYIALIILLCCGAISCKQQTSDPLLENALEQAGENRPELEKVLAHYAGDSLKQEAARYLIRHMPGHYSYADTTALIPYYDGLFGHRKGNYPLRHPSALPLLAFLPAQGGLVQQHRRPPFLREEQPETLGRQNYRHGRPLGGQPRQHERQGFRRRPAHVLRRPTILRGMGGHGLRTSGGHRAHRLYRTGRRQLDRHRRTYELFYWNGQGWTSLGKQEAVNIRLVFRDVPANGLYWLRDLSKGKDERIFTYENGKQVWW